MCKIVEPKILTKNPIIDPLIRHPEDRERRTEGYLSEVFQFFQIIGLNPNYRRSSRGNKFIVGSCLNKGEEIVATYSYYETALKPYRTLDIKRNGKKSNIKSLRGCYPDETIYS